MTKWIWTFNFHRHYMRWCRTESVIYSLMQTEQEQDLFSYFLNDLIHYVSDLVKYVKHLLLKQYFQFSLAFNSQELHLAYKLNLISAGFLQQWIFPRLWESSEKGWLMLALPFSTNEKPFLEINDQSQDGNLTSRSSRSCLHWIRSQQRCQSVTTHVTNNLPTQELGLWIMSVSTAVIGHFLLVLNSHWLDFAILFS